jgi:ferric-dicitrate binding protein FerR (iron transport regulator)
MTTSNDTQNPDPDRALARVFDGARPRPRATTSERDAVFAAVHERWQASINTRRRTRRWYATGALLAASVVIALALTFSTRGPMPAAPSVAQIALMSGDVLVGNDHDPVWRPVAANTVAITQGTRLRTLNGAMRVTTPGGGSLRIDATTVVEFHQAGQIALPRGRVYYDSGARSAAIAIRTPLGVVRNHGTQLSVRADRDEVAVAVRTGAATLESTRGGPTVTHAGQRQTWFASGQSSIVEPIGSADPAWAWADALAPSFSLDGRSALDYLDWVAQQTGYRLQFATDHARLTARNARFRGAGTAGTSVDTLEVALRSVGLRAEVHGDELVVFAR